MFEKVNMQYGEESQNCPKSDKNIIMTFSLLMRLFEWCHEDAKDDVEMHEAMEKIVSFSDGINPLNIDSYEAIIGKGWSDEDAYNLGKQQAENGMDLTPVEPRDYSKTAGSMITAAKNDGNGASNNEIFAFWDGYEGKPLQQGCFTEMDMNDAVNAIAQDVRTKPVTMCFGEQPCECPCEEQLDDDMISQIDAIINAGRM
jgi:hypothetical protein